MSCPNSVLISLSGNGVGPAASYQRLDFVKAAVAFVPSQNWGPSTGVKWKHCISIFQQHVSAQRCTGLIKFLPSCLGHMFGIGTGGCSISPAKGGGNLLVLICLFKWGNFFFSVNFMWLLFAAVWVLFRTEMGFQPFCSIGTIPGAAFPFPLKPLPELYVSPSHSQEGAKCISLAGKNMRKLLF